MSWMGRLARRVRLAARKAIAALLDRLYEGPKTPDRLQGFTMEFVRYYPNATRHEWMHFAMRMGEEMYRSGYLRGHEEGYAAAQAMSPPEDERFNWQWDINMRKPSDKFLAEPVPVADPPTEQGYTDDERALRHLARQHADFARMAELDGAKGSKQ